MQEEQPKVIGPENAWKFTPEEANGPTQSVPEGPEASGDSVTWSASEFIAHEKDLGWFALLGGGTALLMALIFLITRDMISTVIVLVVAIAFGAFATRQPRVLPYKVDGTGVHIGEKSYPYEMFKSFALIQEDGIRSILLLPLKRFMPPISIYMDPEDEAMIAGTLANYLPHEDRQQDPVDRLMRRLRF